MTDCTFLGNAVQLFFLPGSTGGGMNNVSGSNPTVTNCIFSGNTAGGGGGTNNWKSSPSVSYCTFSGNAAMDGGGMSNTVGRRS